METDKLMVAIQGNQELQVTEWKQPVSGDEIAFVKALDGRIIGKSTVEELKQVLRLAMVKVGLRAQNFPTDEEKVVLIDHIMNEYGNHTPEEIKLAFDMAIAFKLELEEKEISCYENFTCLYFSKIMNAYRKWAKEAYFQFKKEPMIETEKQQLTDEEWEEWLVDIKEYKLEMVPIAAYEYLLRKERIKPTTKDKKEYMNKAMPIYSVSIQEDVRKWNEFLKMKGDNKITGNHFDSLVVISKRLIVQDYFKNV